MLSPGLRALRRPAVLATRVSASVSASATANSPRRLAARSFRSTSIWLSSSGNGGKPPVDESVPAQDEEVQPQTGAETSSGRTKVRASASLKSRYARKAAAPALPPVELPDTFLVENVRLHHPLSRPQLPIALAEDAERIKMSTILADTASESNPRHKEPNQALEQYFGKAFDVMAEKTGSRTDEIVNAASEEWGDEDHIDMIAGIVRAYDVLVESAWQLTDALYPARRPQYTYTSRPFWWWHMYRDFDRHSQEFRNQYATIEFAIESILGFDWNLEHSLSQAIADLPDLTFSAIHAALHRELSASPPPKADARTLKRQVTVLSMSGYGGQAISEAVAEHVAFFEDADLIRLDAQDLSVLVGEYLGQDWAYSRGSLSTMGFRAAEMNGKLYRDPDLAARQEEDESDPDTGVINIRTESGSMEDELQKIRQGGYDPFGKWENLKIDKVLDKILQAADLKEGSPRQKPLIIHIHDFVELNMTLEGSMLINRLRSLVDAAWQQGTDVAILGTSSSEQPSEEYQNMVRDLAVGDFVISRHIDPGRLNAPRRSEAGGNPNMLWGVFTMQETDLFVENIRNVNRMLKTLGCERPLDFSSHSMQIFIQSTEPRIQMLKKAILPLPEVYNIACAVKHHEEGVHGAGPDGICERLLLGPLRQRPGQRLLDEAEAEHKAQAEDTQKKAEDAQANSRASLASLKMNEYEKRISSGIINRQNMRTTFDDVHVPKETISALKLLTSLALVRPDAFSYGVLAQDKIPGCLLYGPPGTGKTLLAKAVAKESGANMLEISGATINDKWVGESEKLIRAVFTLAKKISPCVVFIDEADSLLANRSMLGARASHRSHINQFLKEWDGLEETEAFIMVATNRPFDLDDAVLRRLPRRLLVDLPLQPDRAAILKILLKGEDLDASVSLDAIARNTPFYSGSDLKNACIAAAMAAVEEENEAAALHTGAEPYEYPKKRLLRRDHFDKALKQIPASISEDMESLKHIRKFDDEYGAKKKGKKKAMGFGIGVEKLAMDTREVRIRPNP